MKKIMTILGPITPDELGFTTMHEHVMMDGGWVLRERFQGQLLTQDDRYSEDDPVSLANIGLIKRNFMTNWDGLSFDDEDMMLEEVKDFQQSGGKGILELSVPGIRTKVPAIKRIAEKTGLHIIVSTGLYTGDSWSKKYITMSEKDLHDYMLDEITNGIENTGIKPGHLKIAINSLTTKEEQALRAAAKVANDTGLALTVHCTGVIGGDGRRVAEILKEEETDLSRVVIAHAASHFLIHDMKLLVLHPEMMKLNLDYTKELMDFGVNVSLEFSSGHVESEDQNSIGVPDWFTLAGVIELLKQGYSHQIVLGTDTCAKVMTRRGGGEGYCRLTRFAVPKLKEFGVSDYSITMMTERNPRRILSY
jgi:phosphotriesterase-related protein